MSTPYTTKTDVQNYIQKDIDASFDTQLSAYISAMSEYIDKLAGFPVYRTTETTNLYDGNNSSLIQIDHVHTISEVLVGTTEITPLQVPYNADVKTQLKLESSTFTSGLANVSVTGIHALQKDLPDQITHACTVFVGILVKQLQEQRSGVKSEKIGEYAVTFASDEERLDYKMAKEIVLSYRPITF